MWMLKLSDMPKKFEHELQQKHAEFENMLERAKLEKEPAIELKQLESTRPAALELHPRIKVHSTFTRAPTR